MIRHCAATERLCQSRYRCGMSEPCLMLYMHHSPGAHQLLYEIALLIVQGRTPHMGDAVGPVHNDVSLHLGKDLGKAP